MSISDTGSRPHDPALVDLLAKQVPKPFDGAAWRATRLNQDPTAFSYNGGRWAPPSSYRSVPVLYTSLEKTGAVIEMASWLSLLTPPPSKPVIVHKLLIRAKDVVTLDIDALHRLGIDRHQYKNRDYAAMGEAPPSRTQEIGAALSFLGIDGLIVPSARWSCGNLILFDNLDNQIEIDSEQSEKIIWQDFQT